MNARNFVGGFANFVVRWWWRASKNAVNGQDLNWAASTISFGEKENCAKDCDGPITIHHKLFHIVTDCDGPVIIPDIFFNCDGSFRHNFEIVRHKFLPKSMHLSFYPIVDFLSQFPPRFVTNRNSVTISFFFCSDYKNSKL